METSFVHSVDSLASRIDNTLLKPFAGMETIREFCEDSRQFNFSCLCVNPVNVKLTAEALEGSGIKVCSVIGFPLGAAVTKVKLYEIEQAIADGADELDVVINIGWLKSQAYLSLENEINAIVKTAGGKIVKMIIETCFLTYQDKYEISNIIVNCGADFIKTSTGFGTGGATSEDIRLIREFVQDKVRIKASGGISGLKRAVEFLEAGADRLGTSMGIGILNELKYRK